MLHTSKMGSELECKKLWRLSNAVCFDVDSTVCEVVQLTTCDFFKTSKHVIPIRDFWILFGFRSKIIFPRHCCRYQFLDALLCSFSSMMA